MRKTAIAIGAILTFVFAVSCASSPKDGAPDASSGASAAGNNAAPLTESMGPALGGPRTLVVYFSQGTSTRRVAEDLARIFDADVEAIVEKKARSMGFFGFMRAGYQAIFKIASRIEAPVRDPADYGRVLVLTPVWSWNLSPPVGAWLRLMKGRLTSAGFATVSGDTEPDKIAAAMAKESGTEPRAAVGFGDRDFDPVNRARYLSKMAGFVEKMR